MRLRLSHLVAKPARIDCSLLDDRIPQCNPSRLRMGVACDQRRVIVVGAGPVGLSAALAFRAAGLLVTVLESEPQTRVRPGSRAIYVHGTTLALLDRVRPGLGHRLAARGLVWPTPPTLGR